MLQKILIEYIQSNDVAKLLLVTMVVCIFGETIIHSIATLITNLFTKISMHFKDIDTVAIGKFSLKLHKNKNRNQEIKPIENNISNNIKEIDVSMFLNILDIVMSTEIKQIIQSTVNATNDVHEIEMNYEKTASNIFAKNFSTISNQLHNELVNLASSKSQLGNMDIKNTREYFFIINLLSEYKQTWIDLSTEITRRNGFIEFLTDKSKSSEYISELSNSIYQCMDMTRLESTVLKKEEIDKIIRTNMDFSRPILEQMFVTLASIKEKMLEKRKAKLGLIDNNIKNSVAKIIDEIKEKILVNYIKEDKNIVKK